jgi:hypothetical protein
MHAKTSEAHSRPKSSFHGIDANKRLTSVFRATLKSSWLHPYIRFRRFCRDYNVPVAVSAIFLLLVVGAAYLRISQRSSLAGLLAGVTEAGQAYGTLLSNDKTDELRKNADVADETTPATNRTRTNLNVTTSSGTTSTSGSNSSSGGTGSSSSGGSSSGSTDPIPIFAASVASFQQGVVTLECDNPGKPKAQSCSKRYAFSGSIHTENGPGTVNYGWRSSLAAGTEDGSISAGAAAANTAIQKSFTIHCLSPTNFTMQLTIFSPALTQSNVLNIVHNCNEL